MAVNKNELLKVVKEYLGESKIDAKTMQYWEHSLNNGKTIIDFKDFLIKTDLYKSATEQKFEIMAKKLYGDFDNKHYFDKYMESCGADAHEKKSIHKYLVSLPEFVTKFRRILNDLLIYETGGVEISSNVIDFYLLKFADSEYTITQASDDIKNNLHVDKPVMIQNVIDVQTPSKAPVFYNKKLLIDFEDVFQRPMYVQEYFKYSELSQSDWKEILVKHNESYNKLREIFERYTGKSISEYFFIHNYLEQIDNIDFFDNIINSIINSEDYKSNMFKILSDKYKTLYDENLEENDLVYIFKFVFEQKLDIVNEHIDVILSSLKEETDDIVSNIFKQFAKVLERQPDLYDIEQYIKYYRERLGQGFTTINSQLESILMHTLEFHDIIKKRIKSHYMNISKKEILPSMLFDILGKAIAQIDTLTMDNFDQTISSMI